MGNQRVPLYYELFYGLAENEKIEQGLQFVVSGMDRQCSQLVRKMALTVLEEIDYFRELKQHRFSMGLFGPTTLRIDPPQSMEMEQIAYTADPLLEEMAKSVLKEIKYNRTQRKIMQYMVYFILIIAAGGFIAIIGILIWCFA